MTKTEIAAIANDETGIYTPDQRAKAAQALTDYEGPRSGGFTTLIGSQSVCLGSTFETRHFQITVASTYADELLQTRTMEQAAKQACNDRLLQGLRAKYDASEDEAFQKRFPKDGYKLIRVEKKVDDYAATGEHPACVGCAAKPTALRNRRLEQMTRAYGGQEQ